MIKVYECSIEQARYACKNWHYSHALPASIILRCGVYEEGRFIGCILYGCGINKNFGRPYGLTANECCELVRIALTTHTTPVSHIIKLSIELLKQRFPEKQLIVSFADTAQNHHGGIYQATNWIYTGLTTKHQEYIINGKIVHGRSLRRMKNDYNRNLNTKDFASYLESN